VSYSPSTRNVNDVMIAVKRAFGDESGVQLQDSDIIMWINSAQAEINKRNKVMKAKSTQASTIGQSDYTFPAANILQIESLHYNGMLLPNMSLAQAEEDFLASNTPITGEPVLWYEFGGTFTLYPTPPTTQQIALYYTMVPDKVTIATDLLKLPDKYYEQIVAYVLQQAYEMDEDWNASQAKATQFNDALMQMGEEERTAQNMVYDRVTVVEY
jgi:hypothetical protein